MHRLNRFRLRRQARRDAPSEARREALISSAAVMGDQNLLSHIFLRTPVDSLLQLKRVSRTWNTIISDPYFCVERSKNIGESTGLFVRIRREEVALGDDLLTAFVPFHPSQPSQRSAVPKQLSFEDAPLPRSLRWPDTSISPIILESCNGLACLYTCAINQETFDSTSIYELVGHIIVFNPTTRDYREIRWPNLEEDRGGFQISLVEATNLAFDPRRSAAFKILMVRLCSGKYRRHGDNVHRNLEVGFMIYSSEEGGRWHNAMPYYEAADILFDKGVFWDNKIYFPSLSNNGIVFTLDNCTLDSFSMPGPQEFRYVHYFGENRGFLNVMLDHYIDGERSLTSFDLYEFVGDIWQRSYVVENREWDGSFVQPLCFTQSFVVLLIDDYIVRYNCREGTVEPLCQIDDFFMGGYGHIDRLGVLHTPSLAPVVAPGAVVA